MISFTSLFSGSSKNASLISCDNQRIVVGCGGSFKALKKQLESFGTSPEEITAVFITHSHTDHISALSGILKLNPDIRIYSSFGTHEELFDMGIKMHKENRIILDPDEEYNLGDFAVNPFMIPHDTKEPFGYNFYIDGKWMTVATDIGYVYDGLENKIKSNEFILLESNHDINMLKCCGRPYSIINRILGKKGHLCNEASAAFSTSLAKRGLKRIMLGHLSKDANTTDLAYRTSFEHLSNEGIIPGKDILLKIAPRDELSETVTF